MSNFSPSGGTLLCTLVVYRFGWPGSGTHLRGRHHSCGAAGDLASAWSIEVPLVKVTPIIWGKKQPNLKIIYSPIQKWWFSLIFHGHLRFRCCIRTVRCFIWSIPTLPSMNPTLDQHGGQHGISLILRCWVRFLHVSATCCPGNSEHHFTPSLEWSDVNWENPFFIYKSKVDRPILYLDTWLINTHYMNYMNLPSNFLYKMVERVFLGP